MKTQRRALQFIAFWGSGKKDRKWPVRRRIATNVDFLKSLLERKNSLGIWHTRD
jgi:hypothetical protein